jgi:hypothetical protein
LLGPGSPDWANLSDLEKYLKNLGCIYCKGDCTLAHTVLWRCVMFTATLFSKGSECTNNDVLCNPNM